jgi:hypothetical protein
MSTSPAKTDATFPQVAGAAVLVGGAVALVDRYDRRAASILMVTLLLSVMLTRDIVARATEFIDAVSGTKAAPAGRVGPRGER